MLLQRQPLAAFSVLDIEDLGDHQYQVLLELGVLQVSWLPAKQRLHLKSSHVVMGREGIEIKHKPLGSIPFSFDTFNKDTLKESLWQSLGDPAMARLTLAKDILRYLLDLSPWRHLTQAQVSLNWKQGLDMVLYPNHHLAAPVIYQLLNPIRVLQGTHLHRPSFLSVRARHPVLDRQNLQSRVQEILGDDTLLP